MIITVILYVIYYALYGLLSITLLLLDDVSADSSVTSAITSAIQYAGNWNSILPLGTIFTILAAIIAVEIIVATYKLVMWVIRRFPTQS